MRLDQCIQASPRGVSIRYDDGRRGRDAGANRR